MTTQLMVKMALDNWNIRIKNANDLFGKLTDEQLMSEISPGRNRGVYLMGHLTAVHDRLLSLLGFGERMYPHLDEAFETNPDKAIPLPVTISELRTAWTTINSTLTSHFEKMTADDWFKKHTSVSDEDFAKEPHRNKLNVILNRTNHLAYHIGQAALLKK